QTRTVAFLPGTRNPLLPHGRVLRIADGLSFVYVLLFGLVIASVVSLFLRYRRATADQRQALKWIAFAGFLFVVIFGVSFRAWDYAGGAATNVPALVQVLQYSAGIALALP